jgi:hypothetical protein
VGVEILLTTICKREYEQSRLRADDLLATEAALIREKVRHRLRSSDSLSH